MIEQHGVLQPGGERWMALLVQRRCPLKSRSAIKWHRLAHFNQTRAWISWYHAVTHPLASPNPYFTKLGYLCRGVLWGFVTRFPFLSPGMFSRSHWQVLSFCLTDTLTALCTSTLTFSPPLCSASCVAADIISTVEFNSSGELLATGDKGGRVVVFQREQEVGNANNATLIMLPFCWKDVTALKH